MELATTLPRESVPPPYFERVAATPGRALFTWWAVGVGGLAVALVAFRGELQQDFLIGMSALAIAIGAIPTAIHYCFSRVIAGQQHWSGFLGPRASVQTPDAEWFARELLAFRSSWPPTLAGTVLLLVELRCVSDALPGFPWPVRICFGFASAVATFFAGVALYHVVLFGRIVWRLGQFATKVEEHQFGVRSIGVLMSTVWSASALVWLLISTSCVAWGARADKVLFSLGLPTALLLLASFVVCQVPLHDRMREFKRAQIEEVRHALDKILKKGVGNLSADEISTIQFLDKRMASAMALPEWPFEWRSFARVASFSLTPLVPQLFKLLDARHLHQLAAWLVRSTS